MPELDDELMERFQKGDEGAFTLLVRRHERPLINFIAQFIGDRGQCRGLGSGDVHPHFSGGPSLQAGTRAIQHVDVSHRVKLVQKRAAQSLAPRTALGG